MRIAIIAPPWVPVPPPAYGGTEAVLDTLARGLQASGHDVLLYATGDSTCAVPTAWAFEHALGTVETGAASELYHAIRAYETIDDWGADVVHDHTLVGPIYADRLDVPVVTTNHGPFGGELGPLYRVMQTQVPIVAISQRHADLAAGISVGAVIHHGVDVDAFPLGDGDGGYAAFLGRMSPDKGVHTAALVAREAGIPLRIAAKMREPAERAYFREQVEPLLGDDVVYEGELGFVDKIAMLRDATCLINPLAWEEPFGMVIVESMACGTPVVATPWGSTPELVDEGVTGFLRRDIEGLAAVVGPASRLDRTRVRKVTAERFTATRMADEHVRLYRRAIANHRARLAA
ncbi:MAG TPA: glycosyltransferase family 4 protein [Actinomycetota bacterium]|nr:glycosyltransferase family 4 protein [Actinomycetota bacterium]